MMQARRATSGCWAKGGGGGRRRALLDSLVHPDSGIASLSIALGCDASQFDLDSPLPEIPESNAGKSGRERVIERAATIRRSANWRRKPGRAGTGLQPDNRIGTVSVPIVCASQIVGHQ